MHVYTDGSCISNKSGAKGAGAGARFYLDRTCSASTKLASTDALYEPIVMPMEREEDMTNNVAEITAVIASLERASEHPSIRRLIIHTDSSLVWTWFHTQRNELHFAKYDTLVNKRLWILLDQLLLASPGRTYVIKVRSHNGNDRNEEADVTAGFASSSSIYARTGVTQSPSLTSVPHQRPPKESLPPKQCGHLCKDKTTCLHKCCKRHLPPERENTRAFCSH